MRLFAVDVWFSVVDRGDLEAIKAAVFPVLLECAQHGLCPLAVTTGTRAPGPPPTGWGDWQCSVCKTRHEVTHADHMSVADLSVQEVRRTYWHGF
jgi:hypothetical protein